RKPQPCGAQPPTAPQRDRLEPDDPREPQELPARTPHARSRGAHRIAAEHRRTCPETRIGSGRKRAALRDVILCVDQSGSMGTSVVSSGIFGAVLASLPALHTRMFVFAT